MSLSANLLMPDITKVNINANSAIQLGMEAERRGYKLRHTREQDVTYKDGKVMARVRDISNLQYVQDDVAKIGDFYDADLSKDDVLLARVAINYNLHFITITKLLDKLTKDTLVIDNPTVLRESAEKLLVTEFPDLCPPTLVSSDPYQIEEFRKEYKDIIVKPLFGYGGEGIFHVKPSSDNLYSLLEMFEKHYREPVMIQRFLPEIKQGDKRILLIDGKPVGALVRKAVEGNARANVTAGGSAEVCDITKRDLEICERVGPVMNELGIILTGIDVIGDYLVEINVGTVGGIKEIVHYGGPDISPEFWDAVERRL